MMVMKPIQQQAMTAIGREKTPRLKGPFFLLKDLE